MNRPLPMVTGAGEGNRTLVCSLGSCRSAIELHPQTELRILKVPDMLFKCGLPVRAIGVNFCVSVAGIANARRRFCCMGT